jgi:hypothetical protein
VEVDAEAPVDAATVDAAPCGTELDRQGCACDAAGGMRACFTGDPRDRGRGDCRDGVQSCDGFEFLSWGACTGSVTVCGECTSGEERPCYGGPVETRGVGSCRDGLAPCVDDRWEAGCSGEVLPAESDLCGDGLDDDCDGTVDEDALPGTVRVDLASVSGMPASLLSSEPIVLDTARASELVLDTGSSDDFALFVADGETPALEVTGTQVTLHLPARYILLRDTTGYFGFDGDLEVVDGMGRRFFRSGWAMTRVPDLEAAGFPAQPFSTPITAAQLRDLGWVDDAGVARVRLWLATDVGFLHVGVPTLLCP